MLCGIQALHLIRGHMLPAELTCIHGCALLSLHWHCGQWPWVLLCGAEWLQDPRSTLQDP